MTARPLVSVLIASRDGERYLGEALASLAAQTWPEVEIVAVDDGSRDGTARMLERFAGAHPRVLLLRTGGIGLAGALSAAAREATGELLARQDDDDVSHPERLERQVRFLESRPGIGAAGSAAEILDECGARTGDYDVPLSPRAIRRVARRDPPFVHGSVMMRRSAYEAAGGYRTAFRSSEDLDLWLRMDPETLANLPERLYGWRWHGASQTARRRATMLDFAAIARAFAEERRASGRDGYPLLERAGDREALLAIHPRAGRLALHLATAYLRDGRVAEARAFAARAFGDRASLGAAAALWLASFAVALTPRAARARRAVLQGGGEDGVTRGGGGRERAGGVGADHGGGGR